MSNDCPSTLKDFTHSILWWDFYFFTHSPASRMLPVDRTSSTSGDEIKHLQRMCGSFIAKRKLEDNHFCRVWWNIKGRFESDYLMCVISGSTSLTFLSCLHIMRTSCDILRGFPYVGLISRTNEGEWDNTIVNWWLFMCLTFLLTGCFSLLFYFRSSSSPSLLMSSCDVIRSLIIS